MGKSCKSQGIYSAQHAGAGDDRAGSCHVYSWLLSCKSIRHASALNRGTINGEDVGT